MNCMMTQSPRTKVTEWLNKLRFCGAELTILVHFWSWLQRRTPSIKAKSQSRAGAAGTSSNGVSCQGYCCRRSHVQRVQVQVSWHVNHPVVLCLVLNVELFQCSALLWKVLVSITIVNKQQAAEMRNGRYVFICITSSFMEAEYVHTPV